jgi:diguanylate cyclase (GGDEF)-like protein
MEEEGSGFHNVGLEKKAQQSFLHIKSMAESIAISYQKLKKVLDLTQKKIEDLSASPNRLSLLSYEEDLQKIEKSLIVEMRSINAQYKKTAELIKEFNVESIYDKKFDVFNKKYLLKMLDNEINGINKYSHDSVLLAIDIKSTNLDEQKFTKNRVLILQTLAKLLLKRSRRSDVLAHYNNGIFIIMLVHTDLEHSEKAIYSIREMISTASFIVDSESVEIELAFGVSSIEPDMVKEQVITRALDELNKNK